MGRLDGFHHSIVFFTGGSVDLIILIHPCHSAIGGHLHNTQTINFMKFIRLGQGCARHAAQFIV